MWSGNSCSVADDRARRGPRRRSVAIVVAVSVLWAAPAAAQAVEPLRDLARAERPALVETLRDLVSIESGSRDIEGLDRMAEVVAERLRALGGDVERVAPSDVYRMSDTPDPIGWTVVGRFEGEGTRRILLLAHMDTVYERGSLARQAFRIDGDRAYGPGVADDKHGIALILHTLALLQAIDFRDYGTITVAINADEEVSSPGSRDLITRLGAEADVVFSCEGAGPDDRVVLATAGIGAVRLEVTGRASHAGAAPEQGRNALYELAHQILQMRDLSDPATGRKLNWTLASAGTTRNVIPERASATADVRVLRVADYAVIERAVRERIGRQLVAGTRVEATFERRRPPLEATPAARRVATHAQTIYGEIGRRLTVVDTAGGGGTDAAFAALETDAPVLEGLGLRGFGAHSTEAEYVDLGSVEPRLYLLARLIMDVSRDAIEVASP
jgi:glutamate carboxypeptidase